MFAAVENVGKEVVIIKDNKIIAKGKSVTMRGDEVVSIKLEKEFEDKYFNRLNINISTKLKETLDRETSVSV